MLGLVAGDAALEPKRFGSVQIECAFADIGIAFGAVRNTAEAIPAAAYVSAEQKHLRAVTVGVLDGVVIEDLAVVGTDPHLPAPDALGFEGVILHGPVDKVEGVDGLLDDQVAAEPVEVVPVAHLILHFGLAWLAWADPDTGVIAVGPEEGDFADCSVVDTLDYLAGVILVADVQPDRDEQALFLCLLVGGDHLSDAGRVHGDGFFHEDVLVGLDCRFEVQRAEARRCGQQDHIDIGVDDLGVCVHAYESSFGRHVRAVGVLAGDGLVASLETVLEGVGHGDESGAFGGIKRLDGGPGAAPATADQTYFDRPRTGRVGLGLNAGGQGRQGCRRRRILEELPS